MSEVSLYRKYRPHNFENLVGQEHVKTTLINALKSDHVAHAYLFTGPRGTGKTSTARLIAKALNCEKLKDGFEPCNECAMCKEINSGRLIDLIEIDAASNRGIDEVRDLKEKINFSPTHSKYKVYIIDEVHMMTKEAFNALLKTLEEPPDHAYFILATTEVHKIPETIISRCQRFDFRRIELDALFERLKVIAEKESIEADDKALKAIAKHVDGGMRDAIGLMEQMSNGGKIVFDQVRDILGVSDHSLLGKLYDGLLANDSSAALKIVQELHDHGSDLKQFTHEFAEILRENMLKAVEANDKKLAGRIIDMIETIQETASLTNLSIPQLALEIAVVKICGSAVMQKTNVATTASAAPTPSGSPTATTTAAAAVAPTRKKTVETGREATPAKQEPKQAEKSESADQASAAQTAKQEKIQEAANPEQSAAEVNATESNTEQSLNVSLSLVQEKWPRVTERISTPSLRMSLKNGQPIMLNESALTLEFRNNFHKNKVLEHDHRVELESTMKEVLGQSLKLVGVVREVEIKPVTETEYIPDPEPMPSVNSPFDSAATESKKDTGAANAALEIFGGELMD